MMGLSTGSKPDTKLTAAIQGDEILRMSENT
jgi:hypothetical protein